MHHCSVKTTFGENLANTLSESRTLLGMASNDDEKDCEESAFDTFLTYILALIIFIVGLGLGAESTIPGFRESFRKPQAMMCGLASQFGWMPLAAFLMSRLAGLDELMSIGVILVGSSPGGTTSNLFTFWSNGNVPLSITMSFFSTIAAMFMVPLLVLIYIKTFSNSTIDIPYLNIVLSLLLIVIPTVIGLLVRHTNTTKKLWGKFYWEILKILASIFGGVFLVLAIIAFIYRYERQLAKAPAKLWVIAIVMEPLGCAFGYIAAHLTGLEQKDQRTISLECGVQAFTFTMALIKLSFPKCDQLDKVIIFSLLYGIMYLINSLWLVALFRNLSQYDRPKKYPIWWVNADGTIPREKSWFKYCQSKSNYSQDTHTEFDIESPPSNDAAAKAIVADIRSPTSLELSASPKSKT